MFRRMVREFPGLELQMVVSMTRVAAVFALFCGMFVLAGCGGPQPVVIKELTPLEEYNIASEILEREMALLDRYKSLMDGVNDTNEDREYVKTLEASVQGARKAKAAAATRYNNSIKQAH